MMFDRKHKSQLYTNRPEKSCRVLCIMTENIILLIKIPVIFYIKILLFVVYNCVRYILRI